MKQDKFLLGILAGIATLILVALAVFLLRPETLQYQPDDTPQGVVHNYMVALYQQDYFKAYSYLAEDEYKPSYEDFSQVFLLNYSNPANAGVEVLESKISTDQASVEISIIYSPNDPFSNGYRNIEYASLINQGGQWKIRNMPYAFWHYDWYQQPYEDPKP